MEIRIVTVIDVTGVMGRESVGVFVALGNEIIRLPVQLGVVKAKLHTLV